jgi:hypothetical protein
MAWAMACCRHSSSYVSGRLGPGRVGRETSATGLHAAASSAQYTCSCTLDTAACRNVDTRRLVEQLLLGHPAHSTHFVCCSILCSLYHTCITAHSVADHDPSCPPPPTCTCTHAAVRGPSPDPRGLTPGLGGYPELGSKPGTPFEGEQGVGTGDQLGRRLTAYSQHGSKDTLDAKHMHFHCLDWQHWKVVVGSG